MLKPASSLVIRGITTPFSLRDNDQNYSSVKNSTQFQSSKRFLDNLNGFEDTKSMSNFDKKSFKKVTLKSTTKNQCSTSNCIKSNSYLTSTSINNAFTSDNFSNRKYGVDVNQLTLSGNIMQENMGNNLWIVIPTGPQSRY